MHAFAISRLALEWPAELATLINVYMHGAALADHPALWFGDGRITAGHLAVLRERAKAGPFGLILFDQVMSSTSTWSERDEAMSGPILNSTRDSSMLVVAGNAHTSTTPRRAALRRTRRSGVARSSCGYQAVLFSSTCPGPARRPFRTARTRRFRYRPDQNRKRRAENARPDRQCKAKRD